MSVLSVYSRNSNLQRTALIKEVMYLSSNQRISLNSCKSSFSPLLIFSGSYS